jgi:hypothetical protein
VAANLLAEGRYRKGKYVPLASLAQRIGALKLLQMSPNLLFNTFHAQSDDDVCCAASTFLKIFLERLKTDCWSSAGGIAEGIQFFDSCGFLPYSWCFSLGILGFEAI